MIMSEAASLFFSRGRHYFVLGASSKKDKFGHKILHWYIEQELPATPINPNATSKICGLPPADSLVSALTSFSDSQHSSISLSVVTPPDISYQEIKKAADSNKIFKIKSIWFQPGSYDDKVIDLCNSLGYSEDNKNLIYKGACILKSGVKARG